MSKEIYVDKFTIPLQNKDVLFKLITRKNELTEEYNNLLKEMFELQPSRKNYKVVKKKLEVLNPKVSNFLTKSLKWINDFKKYELLLSYKYQGTQQENFQYLDFTNRISSFTTDIRILHDTAWQSLNTLIDSNHTFESLDIARKSFWISIISFIIGFIALIISIYTIID